MPAGTVCRRRIRETSVDDGTWAARWTHQLAAWLRAADEGPLHAGRWMLAWGMPSWSSPGLWDRLVRVDPDQGHICWFGCDDLVEDTRDILPLRRLSAGAGRVKSYRRQYRAGVLPPVLVWWVSGLATLLVVDGHDRITAAPAEGGRNNPDLGHRLATHLRDVARTEGRTRAWPLAGGRVEWDELAAELSPGHSFH